MLHSLLTLKNLKDLEVFGSSTAAGWLLIQVCMTGIVVWDAVRLSWQGRIWAVLSLASLAAAVFCEGVGIWTLWSGAVRLLLSVAALAFLLAYCCCVATFNRRRGYDQDDPQPKRQMRKFFLHLCPAMAAFFIALVICVICVEIFW